MHKKKQPSYEVFSIKQLQSVIGRKKLIVI